MHPKLAIPNSPDPTNGIQRQIDTVVKKCDKALSRIFRVKPENGFKKAFRKLQAHEIFGIAYIPSGSDGFNFGNAFQKLIEII
jgi:hypothetical protein